MKKRRTVIYMILLVAQFFSCGQNFKMDEDSSKKTYNLSGDVRRWENIPRPILVDTASFWTDEDDYQKVNYHINAFSIVDTADILFYKKWSDSILDLLNGGGESIVFFFRDKEGTPDIPIATWAGDERYEKNCFLLIKYRGKKYEYSWSPFTK